MKIDIYVIAVPRGVTAQVQTRAWSRPTIRTRSISAEYTDTTLPTTLSFFQIDDVIMEKLEEFLAKVLQQRTPSKKQNASKL